MLKHVLIAALWLASFFALTLLGSPLMLVSGIPFLTMLAFVVPCIWVLASVLLYVSWASSGWREEWERPAPDLPVIQTKTYPMLPTPRVC